MILVAKLTLRDKTKYVRYKFGHAQIQQAPYNYDRAY